MYVRLHVHACSAVPIPSLPETYIELPTSGDRVYFLVFSPRQRRSAAVELCHNLFAGGLANVTTYEQLSDVNDLLKARSGSAINLIPSYGTDIWVNGKTDATRNTAVNLTQDSISEQGVYVRRMLLQRNRIHF